MSSATLTPPGPNAKPLARLAASEHRLDTLSSWRTTRSTIIRQRFAEEGWFHIPPPKFANRGRPLNDPSRIPVDYLQCYVCRQGRGHWDRTEDPRQAHVNMNPACPLLNLHLQESRVYTFMLPEVADSSSAAVSTCGRLTLPIDRYPPSYWPHSGALSPEEMARAGFFYSPRSVTPDQASCYSCAVSLGGWEPTDTAIGEHSRRDVAAYCEHLRALDAQAAESDAPRESEYLSPAAAPSKPATAASPGNPPQGSLLDGRLSPASPFVHSCPASPLFEMMSAATHAEATSPSGRTSQTTDALTRSPVGVVSPLNSGKRQRAAPDVEGAPPRSTRKSPRLALASGGSGTRDLDTSPRMGPMAGPESPLLSDSAAIMTHRPVRGLDSDIKPEPKSDTEPEVVDTEPEAADTELEATDTELGTADTEPETADTELETADTELEAADAGSEIKLDTEPGVAVNEIETHVMSKEQIEQEAEIEIDTEMQTEIDAEMQTETNTDSDTEMQTGIANEQSTPKLETQVEPVPGLESQLVLGPEMGSELPSGPEQELSFSCRSRTQSISDQDELVRRMTGELSPEGTLALAEPKESVSPASSLNRVTTSPSMRPSLSRIAQAPEDGARASCVSFAHPTPRTYPASPSPTPPIPQSPAPPTPSPVPGFRVAASPGTDGRPCSLQLVTAPAGHRSPVTAEPTSAPRQPRPASPDDLATLESPLFQNIGPAMAAATGHDPWTHATSLTGIRGLETSPDTWLRRRLTQGLLLASESEPVTPGGKSPRRGAGDGDADADADDGWPRPITAGEDPPAGASTPIEQQSPSPRFPAHPLNVLALGVVLPPGRPGLGASPQRLPKGPTSGQTPLTPDHRAVPAATDIPEAGCPAKHVPVDDQTGVLLPPASRPVEQDSTSSAAASPGMRADADGSTGDKNPTDAGIGEGRGAGHEVASPGEGEISAPAEDDPAGDVEPGNVLSGLEALLPPDFTEDQLLALTVEDFLLMTYRFENTRLSRKLDQAIADYSHQASLVRSRIVRAVSEASAFSLSASGGAQAGGSAAGGGSAPGQLPPH
ncbi:hypothetical protein H696_03047 [Fonticula alba]|uniref:Uncharacterized protein n=1 Tax=Fonticula alba TaxID=691883 RepID=A0A058Z8Q9_FONAL|nr:hypothetical protein H696_03047 [Fonticula alba]KCV70694.1 hypothetical protein H696_03047 [Fonticula alba]|eukprot:XP_009495210.1 hypothetical protein H696_03047 [Fonticula alba]